MNDFQARFGSASVPVLHQVGTTMLLRNEAWRHMDIYFLHRVRHAARSTSHV